MSRVNSDRGAVLVSKDEFKSSSKSYKDFDLIPEILFEYQGSRRIQALKVLGRFNEEARGGDKIRLNWKARWWEESMLTKLPNTCLKLPLF